METKMESLQNFDNYAIREKEITRIKLSIM